MRKFSSTEVVFHELSEDLKVNKQALEALVNQVNTNPVLNSYFSGIGGDLIIRLKDDDEVKAHRDSAFFNPVPDDNNGKYAIALNPDWFVGPNAKFPTTATLTVSHELDHYTRVADLRRSAGS